MNYIKETKKVSYKERSSVDRRRKDFVDELYVDGKIVMRFVNGMIDNDIYTRTSKFSNGRLACALGDKAQD